MEPMRLTEAQVVMAFQIVYPDVETAREYAYEEREDGHYMVHPTGRTAQARWATPAEVAEEPSLGILRFDMRRPAPGLAGALALGAGLRALGLALEAARTSEEQRS